MRACLLLLLSACSLDEDRFIEQYGEQTCDWVADCTDDELDRAACLTEQQEGLEALLDRGCTFDAAAAADCLALREDTTCDDPFGLPEGDDACDRVLDCAG